MTRVIAIKQKFQSHIFIFYLSLSLAILWFAFCLWLSSFWIDELSIYISLPLAFFCVFGIALLPGFANVFLLITLWLETWDISLPEAKLPNISILVACYNEENTIEYTIRNILNSYYPNHIELLVINDGSSDRTPLILAKLQEEFKDHPHSLRIFQHKMNQGKASALNTGLDYVSHEFLVTVDADTLLHSKALHNIMSRFRKEEKDKKVGAVAGSIMVKNSKQSWITRIQTWDYFLGIAAIKRQQGTYESTLVAQGAFSAYRKEVIIKLGGWQPVIGEDIVLTWGMLRENYCVFFESTALAFTQVPVTLNAFFRQRKRWARGMFEAFRTYPDIFFHCKDPTKLLIGMNIFFPIIDLSLTFFFIPGLILAFFGIYLIVGIMTLLVLPLTLVMTFTLFLYQRKVYRSLQEERPRIIWSYVVYLLTYSVIQAPISLVGYLEELLSLKKRW